MFSLLSSEVVEQGVIPAKYTGDGENISPPLNWNDAPKGTKGFALTVVDPDVPMEEEWFPFKDILKVGVLPGDLFVHWIVYNIPASATGLGEGASPGGKLPSGAKELNNSGGIAGYLGMGPPPGHKAHRYIFTLYAVNVSSLALSPEGSYLDFLNAIKGRIVATTSLTAYFGH